MRSPLRDGWPFEWPESPVIRLKENTQGRDFLLGDIHGQFRLLEAALLAVDFDVDRDRLILVGDLIDQNRDSYDMPDWLALDWFYSIRGNHEQFALEALEHREAWGNWMMKGGRWFVGSTPEEQNTFRQAIKRMPLAYEIPTREGLVVVIHAELPGGVDWATTKHRLLSKDERTADALLNKRWRGRNTIPLGSSDARFSPRDFIPDVRLIVSGHTIQAEPSVYGNQVFIDVGGYLDKYLQALSLDRLLEEAPNP